MHFMMKMMQPMMGKMVRGMSGHEKENMMDQMMPNMLAGMSLDEKLSMMNKMMPKMLEEMTAGDKMSMMMQMMPDMMGSFDIEKMPENAIIGRLEQTEDGNSIPIFKNDSVWLEEVLICLMS